MFVMMRGDYQYRLVNVYFACDIFVFFLKVFMFFLSMYKINDKK